MNGRLIIISSPSGGGKGTLIGEVRQNMPDLGYSVSHTTRPKRQKERNGREYFFVSREEFQQKIDEGDFLEYAEVHGNLYGTSLAESRKAASSGRDLVVEVDVQGAVSIMDKLGDEAIGIFILPPSYEILEARLTARGTETGDVLRTRLKNAFHEVEQYTHFKYVVINEDVFSAARQIISIIHAERQLRDRQIDAIKGILDSFDASKHPFEETDQ